MMEEEELKQKFSEIDAKLNAIFTSSEKIRRYFLSLLIISVVVFILPLLGLIFAVPAFLNSYTSVLGV